MVSTSDCCSIYQGFEPRSVPNTRLSKRIDSKIAPYSHVICEQPLNQKGLDPSRNALRFLNFAFKNHYFLPFSLSKDSLEGTIPICNSEYVVAQRYKMFQFTVSQFFSFDSVARKTQHGLMYVCVRIIATMGRRLEGRKNENIYVFKTTTN